LAVAALARNLAFQHSFGFAHSALPLKKAATLQNSACSLLAAEGDYAFRKAHTGALVGRTITFRAGGISSSAPLSLIRLHLNSGERRDGKDA